jgi:hypothetical protein
MDSSRRQTSGFIARYSLTDVESLVKGVFQPRGMTIKAAEQTLRNLRLDGLVQPFPFVGNRRLYGLTPRGARRCGLDARKYRRVPTPQTKCEHYTALRFCLRDNHKLLMPGEFSADFPQLAACGRMGERRYFIDHDPRHEVPLLSLIVPDYAAVDSVRYAATKARRAVQERKRYEAWKDLIYVHSLLQLVILTFTEEKAAAIRRLMRHETFPHRVVALSLPHFEDLFPTKGNPK